MKDLPSCLALSVKARRDWGEGGVIQEGMIKGCVKQMDK